MTAPLCCHCGTALTGKRAVITDDGRACCESCAENPSPGPVEHGQPYAIRRAARRPRQVDPVTGRRKPLEGVPFEADPTRYGLFRELQAFEHDDQPAALPAGDEGSGT